MSAAQAGAAAKSATVVIPTRDRPSLLARAIASALAQGLPELEILVVDDGSALSARVPADPRVRLLRQETARGGSAARNAGLARASGRWIAFLDDDDELLPGMLRRGIEAAMQSPLPAPVGALCAVEVLDGEGRAAGLRLPPTLPRGSHWNLESIPGEQAFLVKQGLVAERETLTALGGFDEALRSRVHSDLFLRLNPVCSLVGVPEPGYRLYRHGGPAVSEDRALRQESFRRLVEKHQDLLRRHPRRFAAMLLEHARTCRRQGLPTEALRWLLEALRRDPWAPLRRS